MRRLKNLSFKKAVGILTVSYMLFLIFIFILCFFFLKRQTNSQMPEYYLDINRLAVSEGVAVISPSDLRNAMVSDEALRKVFLKETGGVMFLFAGCQVVGVAILGWGLWRAYHSIIFSSAKKLASYLEGWEYNAAKDEMQIVDMPSFPEDFFGIQKALKQFEDNMCRVYSDFRYLGTYVSHEYKNAMALLRAKIQNGNMQGITSIIDSVVKDMDDILTLCMNRSESSSDEIVDLALVCGMAVDEFRKVCDHIVFVFQEEEDVSVRGNELWIYRAVCNLIDNAIKYGNKSTITVMAGVCHNCPFLEVRDQGEGICNSERDSIFLEGYRIGALKKDGYGIGLSLVKHVAWLSNAYLWLKSGKGKGTSFKMIFPPLSDKKTAA